MGSRIKIFSSYDKSLTVNALAVCFSRVQDWFCLHSHIETSECAVTTLGERFRVTFQSLMFKAEFPTWRLALGWKMNDKELQSNF